MTESDNSLGQYIERTYENLKIVEMEAERSPTKAFETTQYINSLIGLVVFPAEGELSNLNHVRISDIFGSDRPTIKVLYGDTNSFESLGQTLRVVRNAISHYNVEFESRNHEIVGLYLWGYIGRHENTLKCVIYLDVADLKSIVEQGIRHLRTMPSLSTPRRGLALLEERHGIELRLTNPASF